jgi:excisionase family DNA binding protein
MKRLPPEPIRLWSRRELAELFQVDISTIDRWIAKREMDSVKTGAITRVSDTALQDFLHRNNRPATANQRRPGRRPGA